MIIFTAKLDFNPLCGKNSLVHVVVDSDWFGFSFIPDTDHDLRDFYHGVIIP